MKLIALSAALLFCTLTAQAAQIRSVEKIGDKNLNGYIEMHVAPSTPAQPNADMDILFVIDNSGSMDVHQANLSKNIPALLSTINSFGPINIHAGVTTTDMDMDKGKFRGPVLMNSDANFTSELTAQISSVGVDGSATEQPFAATIAALSEPMLNGDHPDFYRPSAHLAVIFLTDAEDQSGISSGNFAGFLFALKNFHAAVNLTSIMADASSACLGEQTPPFQIRSALQLLNGKEINICDPNFGTQLGDLGLGLSTMAIREIPLFTEAIFSSISVTYGSLALAAGDLHQGWAYDSARKVITLGDEIDWSSQPAGTELVIQFRPKTWSN